MAAKETSIIEEESKNPFKGMDKIAVTILISQEEAIRLLSTVGAQVGINYVSGESQAKYNTNSFDQKTGSTGGT